MAKRKSKWQGCDDCGHLAKHPFCTFCKKKMHFIGGLVRTDESHDEIDRNAPARRIDNRLSIAYLLPFMVESGQIPKDELERVTRQVLGPFAERVSDSQVWGFRFSKHPYKFRVVEADITGKVEPYVKVRYGGWSCKDHRGAVPSDLPATVLERDKFECIVCGSKKSLTVTYMIPAEEKGELRLGNMATFCESCVKERGTTDYWSFLEQKGIPLKPIVIDFKTGYVRSLMQGNHIEL